MGLTSLRGKALKANSHQKFAVIRFEGKKNMEEKEMATHSSVLAWKSPRDGRAWWAAVYGVAQSRTQLKRLSSSI